MILDEETWKEKKSFSSYDLVNIIKTIYQARIAYRCISTHVLQCRTCTLALGLYGDYSGQDIWNYISAKHIYVHLLHASHISWDA